MSDRTLVLVPLRDPADQPSSRSPDQPSARACTVAILGGTTLVRSGLARAVARMPDYRVVFCEPSIGWYDANGGRADVVVQCLEPAMGAELIDAAQINAAQLNTAHINTAHVKTAETGRIPAGRCAVLAVLARKHADAATAALAAGASGCLVQDAGPRELRTALDTVAGGGVYVGAAFAAALRAGFRADDTAPPPPPVDGPRLSRRETEALRLVAGGLTHAQAARRMGLAESTVSYYVGRVKAKLNAGNKAQLATRALQLGYLHTEGVGSAA
jgi:DNA-binding NarL/FixJ family response regulator